MPLEGGEQSVIIQIARSGSKTFELFRAATGRRRRDHRGNHWSQDGTKRTIDRAQYVSTTLSMQTRNGGRAWPLPPSLEGLKGVKGYWPNLNTTPACARKF